MATMRSEPSRTIAPPARKIAAAFGVRTALLFLTGIFIAGSAYRSTRAEVGGMLVHPYLPLAVLLFLFIALPRISKFPRPMLVTLIVFVSLYLIALLPGGALVGELSKLMAMFLTVLAFALSIRNQRDANAAIMGLVGGVAIMSIVSLVGGASTPEGINPLEQVANKNAYSLYALPALLLAGHQALQRGGPRWVRFALAVSALLITVAIFSSGNRSGWLGALLIGLMLFGLRRRLSTLLVVGALTLGTYGIITHYLRPEVVEQRVEQTTKGNVSDNMRVELFKTAFEIAADNPVIGISPQLLPGELARRLRTATVVIDPHNAFGLIAGGCGFITLAALAALGFTWWRRPAPLRRIDPTKERARQAHNLVRMMLALWMVRALFTREIFYSPGFGIGLGITIGIALASGAWQRRRGPAARRA
jgi:O-antigen ligase